MQTRSETKRRLKKTLGSLLCLAFGVYTGRVIGLFIGRLVFYTLQAHSTYGFFTWIVSVAIGVRTEELTAESLAQAMSSFENFFRLLGMVFFGEAGVRVHYWYYYLRGIKTYHAFTFDSFRKHFFHIDNAYVDMLWALIYVVSLDTVRGVLCFVAGNAVYGYFSGILGFYAIFPTLFAIILIFQWATETVKNVLHPHRIEWEIQDSSLIKAVLSKREEENLLGRGREEEDE
ncbi:MAG: hypothetical protein KME15_16455 [Drouetiella hepatica Uher 2000/2452]|jgi:hypothetical protein|uniref:Uncharacterized protein n=1 Tax=Drouetiella hepatica Uher 2000/2452 TaxID=904376 RepID=A0A951QCI5_9CYAN|nr:hypothetical protein [Drouetiella hepatica Uher 2000/2452]